MKYAKSSTRTSGLLGYGEILRLRRLSSLLLSSTILLCSIAIGSASQETTWSAVVTRAKPSVVFLQISTASGKVTGSGAIISADGYILTAAHVVEGAKRIEVLIDDKTWHIGTLVAVHPLWRPSQEAPSGDVALIKVDARGLIPIPLGDSSKLEYEEEIRVLGYPLTALGRGFISVAGVLQGKRETPDGIQLLQHTAPTDRGHSGGPVINRRGELVGLEVSGYATGLSTFRIAVAVSSIWAVIPQNVATLGNPRPQVASAASPVMFFREGAPPVQLLHTLTPPPLCQFYYKVALTTDGKILAAPLKTPEGWVITLWDTETGTEIERIETGDPDSPVAVEFSRDGSVLAMATSFRIRIWRMPSCTLVTEIAIPWPRRGIRSISLSSDSTRIAVGTDYGRFSVWDTVSGAKIFEFWRKADDVWPAVFSPDGQILAVCFQYPEEYVGLWDTQKWWERSSLVIRDQDGTTLEPRYLAFSPDGRILAISTGERGGAKTYPSRITLWQRDGTSYRLTRVLQSPERDSGSFSALAFAAGGQVLLAASWGKPTVTRPIPEPLTLLWDLRTAAPGDPFVFPPEYRGESVVAAPNGTVVALRNYSKPFISIWRIGAPPE